MKHESWLFPALLTPLAISAPAYAATYLTVQEAQQALFPGASTFDRVDFVLSAAQKRAIEQTASVRVRSSTLSAWRATGDGKFVGWFLVDEVLGKHEYITYAVALDPDGAVLGIDILEYRETHGDEVRNAKWRAQFVSKRAGAPLKLGDDIANIAGATLSCKHIAEGVRRVLATYQVALKP